ncbi:hypothetical protein [Parvibaculum sp.]|uniref:hypothetical protein n=1 Tax=Parvibaculum sp. TaxID=2024848 RepID=UPI003BAA6B10
MANFSLVVPSPDRDFEPPNSDELFAADILCWRAAQESLLNGSFDDDGVPINIVFDWRPIIDRLKHNNSVSSKLRLLTDEEDRSHLDYIFSAVEVPVEAFHSQAGDLSPIYVSTAGSLIQNFLYDFVLIMNLATPGCCNFYRAELRGGRLPSDVSLSNHYFEVTCFDGTDRRWPATTFVPLEDVVAWYSVIRCGISQVPASRLEKAVFALMHLVREDLSPSTIIWLFYALETLFDTRAGENFRVLRERIVKLLQLEPMREKQLSKRLRQLYDLRSSFVHGNLEVIHPLRGELFDPSFDKIYGELIDAADFGFALLVRSLQEIIKRRWREIEFSEVLTGKDW